MPAWWWTARAKGGIGLAESADGLTWTFRRTVVRELFVLSGPYVFTWQDTHYMIAESDTARYPVDPDRRIRT